MKTHVEVGLRIMPVDLHDHEEIDQLALAGLLVDANNVVER